ncbi:BTAD domain-containing putative transcriptional regulator [Kitasatospora sp. NPDC056184]|uniref:AfsR/SARP family transcriptional regulator n=1 Tax=Kitasatospora sp. NPDC056184 TaxID=3345738 RepID=UPI0035DB9FCC
MIGSAGGGTDGGAGGRSGGAGNGVGGAGDGAYGADCRADGAWQLCALGPLEIRFGGGSLPIGGTRQRAVLATLLLSPGRPVPVGPLIDNVWGGREPASALNTLQSYVSRLRTALARPGDTGGSAPRLLGGPSGYRLVVRDEQLDYRRAEWLLDTARAAFAGGDPAAAHTSARESLALWRGPALGELQGLPAFQWEAARLDEVRLGAEQLVAQADLALGRSEEAVARLRRLASGHPLWEQPQALLMQALYRTGRQAEALALYQRTRRRLVDELGIEPGAELAGVHRAILRQDPLPGRAQESAPGGRLARSGSVERHGGDRAGGPR